MTSTEVTEQSDNAPIRPFEVDFPEEPEVFSAEMRDAFRSLRKA